jgi:hypothetical protein
VQRPLTCEPRGWLAGPTLQPLMGWLHDHTLQEVVTGNPKPKVGAGQTPRPTSHHLVSYRLNQVSNPSLDPYKTPLPMEIKTPHSTCSSPLVKVPV